jgi:dihydroorotate dehydrogenase
MGLSFPNRIGLAAGFDKIGEAIDGIGRLGFGFVEVGTVTPRPQPGQPVPRLFRLHRDQGLINRMGFPNDGAQACATRLRRRRFYGVVGVNIGKNADTPMDLATADYIAALQAVHDVADYIAINISSPNTAALRGLHDEGRLRPLLHALVEERNRLAQATARRIPLVLKISPDLEPPLRQQVAASILDCRIDGVIATNSTVQRPGRTRDRLEVGGLSGRPLHELALKTVSALRATLGPQFPIIGVGGIDTPAAAMALRAAGADLVQLYTGLLYNGPRLIKDCIAATR